MAGRSSSPATPDSSDASAEESEITAESLGKRIRAARGERKITGRVLAQRAQVTPGFISQVERGLVMPSIPTLLRIASALDIPVTALFEPEPRPARLLRTSERRVYRDTERKYREAVLSSDESKLIELVWGNMLPGGGTGDELFTHGSQAECVYVLSGELEVSVDTERYSLREGDCLTFPGTLVHGCANRSSEPTVFLWITSPAVY